MQTNQAQTRDEIEDEIERCKETIAEHEYELRWYTRGVHIIWPAIATSVISFGILASFNIPVLHSLLITVGVVAVIIVIAVGISLGVTSEDKDIQAH